MDLVRPSTPHIDMVQGDRFTRQIEVIPLSDGKPWNIPQDVSAIIRYEKPNKQFGVYDTLATGEPAAYVKGSHLFVTVAPDVLTVAGSAQLSITLIRGDQELSTFAIQLMVYPNQSDSGATDVSGVSVTGMLPAPESASVGQFLIVEKTDENGKVLRVSATDAPEDSTDYTPLMLDVADDMTIRVTVDQITEAYENGKNVWCVYGGVSYPLSRIDTEKIYFCAVTDGQAETISIDMAGFATYSLEPIDDIRTPVKGVDYYTDADKAEMVEAVQKSMEGIPDYWKPHLDRKMDEIWKTMESAGRNKSAFFFYTDAHWWAKDRNDTGVTWQESYTTKSEPMLLKYLYQNTPINKTNFGGDFIGEEADVATNAGRATMEYIHEWRNALREVANHHSVVGNHDDGNELNNRYSEKFMYSYLLAPEEEPEIVYGDGFYYYMDNSAEKTRYIYLDTAYKGLDDAQTKFVKQALLSTQAGWHIVVIAHIWFDSRYNAEGTVTVGDLSPNGATLLSMFDDYNARSGDFTGCGGWVEFCIGGHTHWDYDGTSNGGIPVILCEASSINSRSGLNCDPSTINETAISAIVANYDEAKIDVIRIGRGSNREVALLDHKVITYANLIPLSIGSDGAIFNGGKGWADNSRIGSGGIYLGNGSHYVTGHIEIDPNIDNVFRLRNMTLDSTTSNNYAYGVVTFDSAFVRAKYDGTHDAMNSDSSLAAYPAVYDTVIEDNNIVQFTLKASLFTNKNIKYIAICCSHIDETSIITINQEIK